MQFRKWIKCILPQYIIMMSKSIAFPSINFNHTRHCIASYIFACAQTIFRHVGIIFSLTQPVFEWSSRLQSRGEEKRPISSRFGWPIPRNLPQMCVFKCNHVAPYYINAHCIWRCHHFTLLILHSRRVASFITHLLFIISVLPLCDFKVSFHNHVM